MKQDYLKLVALLIGWLAFGWVVALLNSTSGGPPVGYFLESVATLVFYTIAFLLFILIVRLGLDYIYARFNKQEMAAMTEAPRIQLRGGTTTQDPRLDRLVSFDERSRDYPVRALLAEKPRAPRSYSWRCNEWLDQGQEGACTGFAWAHELAARPAEVSGISNAVAIMIYKRAQQLDQWAGEAYSGSSVIAAVQAAQELYPDKIVEYRWCFGIDDLILTLGYLGPCVLGINWFQGMFNTEPDGRIRPTGRLRGGHAILANRIDVRNERIWLHNSWSKDRWGINGSCYLTWDNLEMLLGQDGEACIPVVRGKEKRRRD